VQQELNQRGASLVMMATHGRGKLGQLALGSVAHELVSKLEVPVLVIGPQAHNASHASPRKILHPVSLTGDYRESVALAIELAQEWKAELTLLYVFHDDIQQQADPGRRVEWARTALSDLLPEDMYLAAPVHAMAAFGKIPEQILKAATEIKADWIVMGVNPHTQPWSLKEDAAYKVIAAAGCPVLTLRHGTKTLPEGTIATAEWSERSAQLLVNAGIG
jgi:nucleotide-binding universal stress UspA family protein